MLDHIVRLLQSLLVCLCVHTTGAGSQLEAILGIVSHLLLCSACIPVLAYMVLKAATLCRMQQYGEEARSVSPADQQVDDVKADLDRHRTRARDTAEETYREGKEKGRGVWGSIQDFFGKTPSWQQASCPCCKACASTATWHSFCALTLLLVHFLDKLVCVWC